MALNLSYIEHPRCDYCDKKVHKVLYIKTVKYSQTTQICTDCLETALAEIKAEPHSGFVPIATGVVKSSDSIGVKTEEDAKHG